MLKLFLLIYLPLAVVFTVLSQGYLEYDNNLHLARQTLFEEAEINVARNVLEHELDGAVSDLRFLADLPSIKHFSGGQRNMKKQMEEYFMSMARHKRVYDQIRYLDKHGMEIVRINFRNDRAEVVPDNNLQNKSERDYFRETIKLPRGGIYISPLDLNIEHGQIEIPYNPMLRFATPLFDAAGEKNGIVVINYKGGRLLENFRRSFVKHGMLLNSDGYWLSSSDARQEWGFMFGRRESFATAYPEEWKRISTQEKGLFMSDAGMLAFSTAYPLPDMVSYGSVAGTRGYLWKIVSLVPSAELPQASLVRSPFFAVYAIGLALLALLAYLWAGAVAARRKMYEARVENALRLEEITATLEEGLLVSDQSGHVTYANPEAGRLLGWNAQELIGQQAHDWFCADAADPQSGAPENNICAAIRRGEKYRSEEESFLRKDGSRFPVSTIASPIVRDGKSSGAVIAFKDISERKHLETAINKHMLEIEDLYNTAPCGYHSLDNEGRIIRINQTEADWLGYTREELTGRRITEFHAPSSAKSFAMDFPRFKREGFVTNIEVDLLRKDGTSFTALLSSKAVYDAGGNYLMNHTTMVDITVRKWAENELRDSEERFRQLFEKAPIGIAMTNENQQIFAANAAYCKLFGYTQEELMRMTITGLTHPDHVDMTRRLATDVLSGEIPLYTFEKKYLRKGGETFWGRIMAFEIKGHGSRKRYLMGMVEDISNRIEQEEHRLAKVREQRDVLVREVHHRIKNNLQGVVGLLRQHASDHPEIAEITQAAIGRINSIAVIHGLQAQTQLEDVNLDRLMASIIEASGDRIEYENRLTLPVSLNREETVPIALALNELITNACKHRSANSLVAIELAAAGSDTVITIANHFDVGCQPAAGDGLGLNMVKSLLPRKSAHLLVTRAGNVYTVELKLSSPVAITGIGYAHNGKCPVQ
ncbi:MAG: PAS domain S-box protein [Nitrosomonadales bacterium]|nr:PAS domain S-box protein [Nitrosomonadales bacterium]